MNPRCQEGLEQCLLWASVAAATSLLLPTSASAQFGGGRDHSFHISTTVPSLCALRGTAAAGVLSGVADSGTALRAVGIAERFRVICNLPFAISVVRSRVTYRRPAVVGVSPLARAQPEGVAISLATRTANGFERVACAADTVSDAADCTLFGRGAQGGPRQGAEEWLQIEFPGRGNGGDAGKPQQPAVEPAGQIRMALMPRF